MLISNLKITPKGVNKSLQIDLEQITPEGANAHLISNKTIFSRTKKKIFHPFKEFSSTVTAQERLTIPLRSVKIRSQVVTLQMTAVT